MAIEGYATIEGTGRYRERMVAAGLTHPEHFRKGLGGLALSSVGLGTYLGWHAAATDAQYLEAVKQAVASGCNVFDSAINYRCQRSERVIGQALSELVQTGAVRRDELLFATKGGFIPFDGAPPQDSYAYVLQTFVHPGIIASSDVVAECHCMTPAYLRHQLKASMANLGLASLDVYCLHDPETTLGAVRRAEMTRPTRAAGESADE